MKEFLNPATGKVYGVGEQIKTRCADSTLYCLQRVLELSAFRTLLLRTLRHLANSTNPVQDFYEGDMAREMAGEFQRFGSSTFGLDHHAMPSSISSDSPTSRRNSHRTRLCRLSVRGDSPLRSDLHESKERSRGLRSTTAVRLRCGAGDSECDGRVGAPSYLRASIYITFTSNSTFFGSFLIGGGTISQSDSPTFLTVPPPSRIYSLF